jgi:uncharacterized membrane protein
MQGNRTTTHYCMRRSRERRTSTSSKGNFMNTYLRVTVRLAVFAVALGTWTTLSTPVHADGRVCNPAGASEAKWVTVTKGDASCGPTTRRQTSWYLVQPGTCATIYSHSAQGRIHWYFQQGANTGNTFPSLSSTSNRWLERFNDTGFGTFPGSQGTCFDQAQNNVCAGLGVTCQLRPHFNLGVANGTRIDIGL